MIDESMDTKIDAWVAEYRRQLLAPDFDGFEAYFGCPIPPELQRLYEMKDQLLAGVLYATVRYDEMPARIDFIQYVHPMNDVNWTGRYGREFFQFATDTDGYALLIKPTLARSPVFGDWGDGRSTFDIEPLNFTLWEVVDTLSNSR